MISNLPAAIEFYELRDEIYRLLTLYYGTIELDAGNDKKARDLIVKIETIELKHPMKAGVIVKEQRDEA